jgi:hypothetical protein
MNKTFVRILIIYIFAFVFILSCMRLGDGDFWFHLKTGELVVQNHFIPRTEPFSFTHFGRPWVAHGWLSGVVFYLLYSAGGFNVLILSFGLLVTFAFWILFRRIEAHPVIAGAAVFLCFLTVLTNVGARPRVFTLLLSIVFLWILNRYTENGNGKAIWWLVPLMVVWANLHGGFLIGFALIGITIVGEVLDGLYNDGKLGPRWPKIRTLTLVLVGCLLAGLLNPYGTRLYTFPLQVVSSKVFSQIVIDWMAPNFQEKELRPFLALLFLTITSLVLAPKRARPSELILLLATLYASLTAQRNILIFSIVATPLLAKYLQSWLDSTALGKRIIKAPATDVSRGAPVLIILALLPLIVLAIKLKQTVFVPTREQITDVPVQAVEYLKQNQITGNTFTEVNIWGGYLIWALPSNPVYIDGRDVYPDTFVKEFVDMVNGIADWRVPFNRYGVKVAIVRPGLILARELSESVEWQQVFQDQTTIVFVRKQ